MGNPMIDRYNRNAAGYERCWAPVLHPGARLLLGALEARLPGLRAGDALDVLEAGCGTGRQLLEAVRRWPGVRLTGLDASAGMLGIVERARGDLTASERQRVQLVLADAAAMPFPDARFDAVASAFMVQLVSDRGAVLDEMRRVLRPGGSLAIAGWLQERADVPFEPEAAFEACLSECRVVRPIRHESRAGDFASVRAAVAEVRRAGFLGVAAKSRALDHEWTPDSYATYKRVSREADLYRSLEPELADRLESAFRDRLERLYARDRAAFRFRPPIVTLLAVAP